MADLLADPVLSGFATAAAFLVGTSQLKHAFGMTDLKSDWGLPKAWLFILMHLDQIAWQPVLLCLSSIAFLVACKASATHIKGAWLLPGPLTLVIAGCALSFVLDFAQGNAIKTVGQIPGGLPSLSNLPTFTLFGDDGSPEKPLLRSVLLESVKLSSIFFIIHVSITKSIALRQSYKVDYSQELLAFSMANVGGSFFQCYPTCTSISRSSVAEGLGSRNGLQSPMASFVVLITLIYLTRLLEYLPMPCLAAVVFVGVSHMTEFREFRRLWTLQKAAWQASNKGKGGSSPDLFLWCISFLVTACLGATEGLLAAAALSLIWIGKSILRPPFMELGRLPGTTIYRDIRRFPHEVEIDPHIAIYRIDAPLNFCNAGYIERIVNEILQKRFTVAQCGAGDINFANDLGLKKVSSGNFEIFRKELTTNKTDSTQNTTTNSSSELPRVVPTLCKDSRQSTLWTTNISSEDISAFPSADSDFHLRSRPDKILDETATSPDTLALSPSINSQHPPYVELTTSPSMEEKKMDFDKLGSDVAEERRLPSELLTVPPNVFILDCSSVNGLDVTAIAAIKRTVLNAASMGVIVAFSNWKGPQRDYLWRADFYSVVPPQRCFLSNYDAYLWACALRYAYGKCDELRMCSIKWSCPTLVGPQVLPSSSNIVRHAAGQEGCSDSSNFAGLSALVPNIRVVHEDCGGSCRDWEVSIHDDC